MNRRLIICFSCVYADFWQVINIILIEILIITGCFPTAIRDQFVILFLIGVFEDAIVEIRLTNLKVAVWCRHVRKLLISRWLLTNGYLSDHIAILSSTDLSSTNSLKRILWILVKHFLLFHVIIFPALLLASWCRVKLMIWKFTFVCEVDVILGGISCYTSSFYPTGCLVLGFRWNLMVVLRCRRYSQGLIILILLDFAIIHLDGFLTHLLPPAIGPWRALFILGSS